MDINKTKKYMYLELSFYYLLKIRESMCQQEEWLDLFYFVV
jgi:hypothetical protein